MRKLSEAAAAVIALKWTTRLVDRTDHYVGRTSIHNSLLPVLDVWVSGRGADLTVDKDALAALRESLGVWRALSCCHGYGGYENPRFWDKVVRQFVLDYGNGYSPDIDNDDMNEQSRIDFHDELKSPSHVTLKFTVDGLVRRDGRDKDRVRAWMRNVCRELFQLSDVELAPLSADYQRVLQQLQPFMNEQRFAREPIAVELAFQTGKVGRNDYTDPDMMETNAAVLHEIAANPRRNAPVETPILTMQYASFGGVVVSTRRELQAFTSLMARNPFPITNMCPTINRNLDPVTMSRFLATILQIPDLSVRRNFFEDWPTAQGKLEAMMYFFTTENRHPLACWFSALPYAQSLQTLRLAELGPTMEWVWTKFECYWLAYACFHPRSKTSSWDSLCALLATMTDEAHEALEEIQQDPARALSATRLAVVSGAVATSEARSDRLQVATVAESATIYVKPSDQAAALITLGGETELEMCDLHAQDWLCVLVPGYGFGWVQASDVVAKRAWIPEGPVTSSLQHLVVPSSFSVEEALLLLNVLGSEIETLTLHQGCESGSILEKLALRCPKLKSLTLGHKGESLSQHSLKRFFSSASGNLESLTIEWENGNTPVLLKILSEWTRKAAVKRLKSLQLSRLTPEKCGPAQMAALEAMLQRNQFLEQLVFQVDDAHCSWDLRASAAGLEKHNGDDIHRMQQLRQRLAFLSVMKRRREEQRQQALDPTVLATIFDFAIAPVRRIVYLPPVMLEC
ncbi:hypothetical protein Gpo141_00013888 [Globisporangium polare]